jgi:hypothetical protein
MTPTLFTKKFGLALANLMITVWTFTGGLVINYLYGLIDVVLNFKAACKELTKDMDFCKTGGEVNTWGLIISSLLFTIVAPLCLIFIACLNIFKYYHQVVNFDEQVYQNQLQNVTYSHSLIETIKQNVCESNLITAAWANSITQDTNSIALVKLN